MIRVRDLTAMPDVTIVNEPGVVVARIAVEVAEVVENRKLLKVRLPLKAPLLPRVKRKKPPLR